MPLQLATEGLANMWPRIRGVLITLVLFFATIEALPVPSLKRRHLKYAMAQEELQRWTGILDRFGVEVTDKELAEHVLTASKRSLGFRWKIIGPYRKLERKFKMGQAWGMFAFTDNRPGRLIVEVSSDGEHWVDVIRAPDSDGSRLASAVTNRRMRGVWDDAGDRPRPGGVYRRWVDWLARRLFAERPEVNHVRVRFEQISVWPPGHKKRTNMVKLMNKAQRDRGSAE